jgi:hypothetical protein
MVAHSLMDGIASCQTIRAPRFFKAAVRQPTGRLRSFLGARCRSPDPPAKGGLPAEDSDELTKFDARQAYRGGATKT